MRIQDEIDECDDFINYTKMRIKEVQERKRQLNVLGRKSRELGNILGTSNPNCKACNGTGNDGMGECLCVEKWEQSI